MAEKKKQLLIELKGSRKWAKMEVKEPKDRDRDREEEKGRPFEGKGKGKRRAEDPSKYPSASCSGSSSSSGSGSGSGSGASSSKGQGAESPTRDGRSASSSPPKSPEPNCSICLSKIEEKAFADKCFHSFCRTCLFEWAKVKAECPVCRQPFEKVIYNVRALDDYDEHPVPSRIPTASSSFSVWTNMDGVHRFIATHPFRYHSTLTPFRRRIMEFERQFMTESSHSVRTETGAQTQRYHIGVVISSPASGSGQPQRTVRTAVTAGSSRTTDGRTEFEAMGSHAQDLRPPGRSVLAPGHDHFPPAVGTGAHRRYIYDTDLWVLPYGDGNSRRYREVSAAFFRHNPACTHRLIPWLNRELLAILDNPYDAEHLISLIIKTLSHNDIVSRQFRRVIEPYTLLRTDHFIHEFFNFARSYHDMEAYSRSAVYVHKHQTHVTETQARVRTPPGVRYEDTISVTDSESSNTSCIEVVDSSSNSPRDLPERPETPEEMDETVDVILEDSGVGTPRAQSVNINIIDDFDNPTPGPSGYSVQRNITVDVKRDDNNSDSEIDVGGAEDLKPIIDPNSRGSVRDTTATIGDESDSGESVTFVEYKKPRRDRTPEVIDLGMESSADEGLASDSTSRSSRETGRVSALDKWVWSTRLGKSKKSLMLNNRARYMSISSSDEELHRRDSHDDHKHHHRRRHLSKHRPKHSKTHRRKKRERSRSRSRSKSRTGSRSRSSSNSRSRERSSFKRLKGRHVYDRDSSQERERSRVEENERRPLLASVVCEVKSKPEADQSTSSSYTSISSRGTSGSPSGSSFRTLQSVVVNPLNQSLSSGAGSSLATKNILSTYVPRYDFVELDEEQDDNLVEDSGGSD